MTEEVLVDTSAWLALADQDDQNHPAAADIYPSLLKSGYKLITTNLIIAESYIVIRRALGHRAAISFLDSVRASPRISKIHSSDELERQAEEILKRYDDQDFSYTDAVSFALMTQRRINRALAFDRHFVIAGFATIPSEG